MESPLTLEESLRIVEEMSMQYMAGAAAMRTLTEYVRKEEGLPSAMDHGYDPKETKMRRRLPGEDNN